MSASLSVSLEFARALGAIVALPLRIAAYLLRAERSRAEVLADLSTPSPVCAHRPPGEHSTSLPDRPLVLFIACAEPSGEIHACNLVYALRQQIVDAGGPEPVFIGLGGARLAALGVRIVANPVDRATMGLGGVWSALPFYLSLLRDAVRAVEDTPVDVFVPIDSPALHVPLARMVRKRGVPVVHFVTPQYWAWAPWRARAYRSAVDLALTILPFEPSWFERSGIPTAHVGHPLLDELAPTVADAGQAQSESQSAGSPAPVESSSTTGPLVLLPGSRRGVIERNLPWMLRVLAAVHAKRSDLRVVLPHSRPEVRELLEEHIRVAGAPTWLTIDTDEDLHTTLAGARAAFSVSGTILIDLLHQRLPAVVLYRLGSARESWMYRHLLTTPWFSSPNLLAASEVLPEFCFDGEGPFEQVVEAVERAFADADWRAECRRGLELARERLGPAGATERAAEQALAVALGASSGPQSPAREAGS